MKLALCGNPNVGKTTLFNRLTRSDAPVGNWHGVTVDVRTKRMGEHTLSDLPGAYSLTARTSEERITCDNVLYGDYDVIVYVAEVNNLRRNLYMFVQLLESGKKTVLVVNMLDEATGKVDLDLLSKRLSVPVVGTSVRRKNPKTDIISAAEAAFKSKHVAPDYVNDTRIKSYAASACRHAESAGLKPEFAALKTMERDETVITKLCGECSGCVTCGNGYNEDVDLPARLRYKYIDKALVGVVQPRGVNGLTRKIDRIVLGRLALPVFFVIMALVFVITFEVGRPLSELLVLLTDKAASPILASDMPPWVISLLTDGVIAGVGGVLAFLPQVVLLFLLTALLQDSGYMSRVAFVTDDFFKKFGLSGRAAFSLVLGLGCSATAVLSTRGMSGDKARKRTAFSASFCPCSARLAVFTAITGYFGFSGIAVALMYVIGFIVALAVLKAMQTLCRDDENSDLIMEMPRYRVPSARRVAKVVLSNVLSFVSRVGSVVLGVSVIMWVLCNFSVAEGFTGGIENGLMNTFAGLIAPLFKPLGFGNWKAVAALISGVAAKETVISVIAALGGMSEVFSSPHAAMSFMIFTCLYVPCIATVSALAKENGIKSAALSVVVHTVVAYIAALVYYGSAMLFINSRTAFYVLTACEVAAVAAIAVASVMIGHRRRKRLARI